ncbi:MAG TPA: MerR family transcriptional regulator [Mycobacteriales bacterium]|jgi:Predicted transcriptional regulators
MEWSIQEVARITGTTSRTLRHYGDVGLLAPSRVASNGYRYYDQGAMVRLQRILLLRELGLGLPAIADVLSRRTDIESALRTHIGWLRTEQARIDRQIASIERTLTATRHGGELTMNAMFDGFDHTRYREEVEQRWGADAYARSAAWWESQSDTEKADWQRRVRELGQDWIDLARSGADPAGDQAQALAERHVAWLTSIPGTPAADGGRDDLKNYVVGLAGMYEADPRFAANYGGEQGASFVRRALEHHAETNL